MSALDYMSEHHIVHYREIVNEFVGKGDRVREKLKLEVEKATKDDRFSWLKISWETKFIESPETFPDSEIKEDKDAYYYFQLLTFDILYPERALSLAEQELLRRTVLYLLLDIIEEKGRIWVSSEVLLEQLHSMTPFWAQLEDYHLYCLHNYFFELKGGYSLRIKHLQLCERDHRPYLDVLRQCIDAGYTPYCHIPYYKWPPFEINGKTDESMAYFKSEWLKVVDEKIKQ